MNPVNNNFNNFNNSTNLNQNFANLSMDGPSSYSTALPTASLIKPFEPNCEVCMWETMSESQRVPFGSNTWSDDVLSLHRSKHLPFMQQGVHYTSASPFFTTTNFSAHTSNAITPIVKERIIKEVDVYPERVEVFERHVYPEPQVVVSERLENITEIEKEIIHVHPVLLEREIVHVHPSIIEKEITHVQPVTVHLKETVMHAEQVVRKSEEKVLTTEVLREQERDILPTRVEHQQQQIFAEEFTASRGVSVVAPTVAVQEVSPVFAQQQQSLPIVQQQTVQTAPVVVAQQQPLHTEVPIVQQTPILPQQQALAPQITPVASETVGTTSTTTATTTNVASMEKPLDHHTAYAGTNTRKASGKKQGFLQKLLHPHSK